MMTLNCKGRLLELDAPVVMGIMNTTPDSFYEGSRLPHAEAALRRAEAMLMEGAAILDIGGQSTRPGSEPVGAEEELRRVVPVIEAIARAFPEAIISIDTYYAPVAGAALDAGAAMVNDVSAGAIDEALLPLVAQAGVPYVLMHMQGHPQTMQLHPHYENVTLEVFDALNAKLHHLRAMGIPDVIIDPGFGFGKTAAHNFELLRGLRFFEQLGCPLMVGLSRKATVYKTLGVAPEDALNGTTVLHTIALLHGARILRAHDVRAAGEAIRLVEAYKK